MPYGRIMADAILQPNGKILIINGARVGKTGATAIGTPNQRGAAPDVIMYDPYAPVGQKFKVFAASPIQRLYHSTAVLLPDGRTLVAGTDEATFTPTTCYEHRIEAFTPPWLLNLDINPRPVILAAPQGKIAYNTTSSSPTQVL